jgi:hypothetical protein
MNGQTEKYLTISSLASERFYLLIKHAFSKKDKVSKIAKILILQNAGK